MLLEEVEVGLAWKRWKAIAERTCLLAWCVVCEWSSVLLRRDGCSTSVVFEGGFEGERDCG